MTDLEQELLRLLNEERAKNDALLEMLMSRVGLLEQDETVVVPANKAIGRVPWYERRKRLERLYKRREDASQESETVGSNGSGSSRSDNGSPSEGREGVRGEDLGSQA